MYEITNDNNQAEMENLCNKMKEMESEVLRSSTSCTKKRCRMILYKMLLYMGSSTTKIVITTQKSDYKFLNIFYFIINETHCHHSLAHCQLCSFFVAPPAIP